MSGRASSIKHNVFSQNLLSRRLRDTNELDEAVVETTKLPDTTGSVVVLVWDLSLMNKIQQSYLAISCVPH